MIHVVIISFLVFANVGAFDGSCPANCSCTGEQGELTVGCHETAELDPEQLSQQLDSLLSGNLTYGRLTSLSIVNSPLRHVPRSVCRLTTLTSLRLDHNRLAALPDNCFNQLKSLESLSVSFNYISKLQDGLFNRLIHLRSFDASHNVISEIGLSVFNASSDLQSLFNVDLSENSLTTLEPWPMLQGTKGNVTSVFFVDISSNNISHFTNGMRWKKGQCGKKIVYAIADFSYNQLEHLTDNFRIWDIEYNDILCLFPFRHKMKKGTVGPHSTFRIFLTRNPFNCDCMDFNFYTWVAYNLHTTFLKDVKCAKPETFLDKQVARVVEHLDEIICTQTEQCPTQCSCVYRPANATLHVYCSNTNKTQLPFELPPLPKSYTKYKLDFSYNLGLTLQPRAYFAKTAIADFSNCGLHSIDEEMWKTLSMVPIVYLNNNQLESLPYSVTKINVSTKHLYLEGNPWQCSCDNSRLSDWMRTLNNSVTNAGEITCESPERLHGRNIFQTSKDEFCVDPVSEAMRQSLKISIPLVATAILFMTMIAAGVTVYHLRFRLYKKFKFHPFDRDECLGENMHYDVFFCCSSQDHSLHGLRVLQAIESKGYRVCYHLRDFLAGEVIVENIANMLTHSKRTICFLTENFLQSLYCMEEFRMSYHHNVVELRKKRLIVLNNLYDGATLGDAADDGVQLLRQFLRQYTYIDYTADDWFDRLRYALPLNGLGQQQNHGDRYDDDDDDDVRLLEP